MLNYATPKFFVNKIPQLKENTSSQLNLKSVYKRKELHIIIALKISFVFNID